VDYLDKERLQVLLSKQRMEGSRSSLIAGSHASQPCFIIVAADAVRHCEHWPDRCSTLLGNDLGGHTQDEP
jgi:hypothetical protein